MDLVLIAFASLTPMIFVSNLWGCSYGLVDVKDVANVVIHAAVSTNTNYNYKLLKGFIVVVKDVILLIILFFPIWCFKKPI